MNVEQNKYIRLYQQQQRGKSTIQLYNKKMRIQSTASSVISRSEISSSAITSKSPATTSGTATFISKPPNTSEANTSSKSRFMQPSSSKTEIYPSSRPYTAINPPKDLEEKKGQSKEIEDIKNELLRVKSENKKLKKTIKTRDNEIASLNNKLEEIAIIHKKEVDSKEQKLRKYKNKCKKLEEDEKERKSANEELMNSLQNETAKMKELSENYQVEKEKSMKELSDVKKRNKVVTEALIDLAFAYNKLCIKFLSEDSFRKTDIDEFKENAIKSNDLMDNFRHMIEDTTINMQSEAVKALGDRILEKVDRSKECFFVVTKQAINKDDQLH
eukprot:TRINITY_DN1286_c0_g1_i1.p5 TRINITY_DN1286_c0_g1~~TRINITY_DN1286_c0_g1_i1.p5  ORF type:complete len:341 (+),score=51.22 TRINITY_DN1286_c0_g1_i1:38-1024(+)